MGRGPQPGSALSPRSDSPSGSRVAVVGGGLAGASAALACADAGADVTLLEVRPRLGGAAYSFRRDGLWIDNGQHVFLRCCTAYRAYLERVGAAGAAVLQRRLSIPVLAPGGRAERLERNAMPAPLHLAASLARYRHLTLSERARCARTALALARLDREDPALDRVTFGDWLVERGESPAAVEALWNLIALPTLNLPASEASLGLAAQVFQIGLLDRRDAGDVGYAGAPLSNLHDEPARRALSAAGADVRMRWRAERIVSDGRGFEIEGPVGKIAADAVVLAVPPARAAGLLPAGALPYPDRLERLGESPIVNLHVVYDRAVTDLPFAAAVASPIQWVFDRTASSGLASGQYLAVSLSGATEEITLRPRPLRERFLPALAELFPGARDARVERFFATREPAATFRAAPGVARLRPGARTRVPGLVLAGAWTDTGWPATMEGAVRSGLTAAEGVVTTLAGDRPAGAPARVPDAMPPVAAGFEVEATPR